MSDDNLLIERLQKILIALERILQRFESITEPQDFRRTEVGLEHLDSIYMILLAIGEAFKQIH
ncbi:MAG: hypothetical protein RLZZ597_645 [Cyanobacteriota bacterium]|jgi:hypothetical protein